MEKILASFSDAIYVGSGHSDIIKCTDNVSKEYDKIFVVFQMRNKEIVPLLAKRCPNCNKVFLKRAFVPTAPLCFVWHLSAVCL